MKGIIFTAVFVLSLVVLSGCYTIPRHYNHNTQEIIIIHDPGPPPPPDYYYPPVPPSPPVYYPVEPEQSNPPRNRKPEKPQDSYQQRDPLQGGSQRGSGEIKTDPPVRNPQQKDRGHE